MNEQLNPAADEFLYGNEVYATRKQQSGVVAYTNGTLVWVKFYDKYSGKLSKCSIPVSMQDLINDSSK